MNSSNEISIASKIFALANNLNSENTDQDKEQLTAYINDLITNDFPSLDQLLYRIDIDEKKLKQLLQQNQNTDAGPIISELILARQLQKNEIKKKFKKPGDVNEDEVW